jgi:hypothetical protein
MCASFDDKRHARKKICSPYSFPSSTTYTNSHFTTFMPHSRDPSKLGYRKIQRVFIDVNSHVSVRLGLVHITSSVPPFDVHDQREIGLADALNPSLMGRVVAALPLRRRDFERAEAFHKVCSMP